MMLLPSFNRYLCNSRKLCNKDNSWWMIENSNEIKDLVVSRSRTVNSPLISDFVCMGFQFSFVPTSTSMALNSDSKLTFEDHVLGMVNRVTKIIGLLWLVKRIFSDTFVLLRCYYTFVLKIHEPCLIVF